MKKIGRFCCLFVGSGKEVKAPGLHSGTNGVGVTTGQTIPLRAEPTYLDEQQNKTLPFRKHLESLRRKLTFGLLRQLAK